MKNPEPTPRVANQVEDADDEAAAIAARAEARDGARAKNIRRVHYKIGFTYGANGMEPSIDMSGSMAPTPPEAVAAYRLGRAHGWKFYSECMVRIDLMTQDMIEAELATFDD